MADVREFKGFFSHAHHDAQTDAGLIADFTEELERRVKAKLVNAKFSIWRDKAQLRTGVRWNPAIEAEVRAADVLIVLLTPQWIGSDFCRREYMIFEEVEASRAVGDYVAPILARPIEQQEKHFTPEQRKIFSSVRQRQYFEADATGFLKLSKAQRSLRIDKIADDIAGMIERLRVLPQAHAPSIGGQRFGSLDRRIELDSRPEPYIDVDYLRPTSEVQLDRTQEGRERGIYAQVEFVERLFVRTDKAYVEFGINAAYLSLVGAAPGQLKPSDEFRVRDPRRANYLTHREVPDALTVGMSAASGRGLAELALPPTDGNYWSRIGMATPETRTDQLRAELRVSFSPQGLQVFNDKSSLLSPAKTRKIEAILKVALGKQERMGQDGRICRELPIRVRPE